MRQRQTVEKGGIKSWTILTKSSTNATQLVMPSFVPAAEPLLFRQKWPKPVTPRQASLDGTDANLRGADQLAALKQGLLNAQSVCP
ncbi:hypothetical protein [Nitrospira sp. Ecomares 2.1]